MTRTCQSEHPDNNRRRDRAPVIVMLVAPDELDLATIAELRTSAVQALASEPGTLLIDVSAVTFIDAAGVGGLVAIHDQADFASSELVLHNPSPAVVRILTLTGLGRHFRQISTSNARWSETSGSATISKRLTAAGSDTNR